MEKIKWGILGTANIARWATIPGIKQADNAILYAGVGTEVTLTAQEQADAWLFTFSDNGVGVPPEHLPRLFERFYRVDKGRSRELGGTGLGLAIVKNAVQLHGGTITASLSDGLTFRFTLKKDTQR